MLVVVRVVAIVVATVVMWQFSSKLLKKELRKRKKLTIHPGSKLIRMRVDALCWCWCVILMVVVVVMVATVVK